MGKCAWCGAYIPDSGNKKMAKSLMGSLGLDLVVDAAGALTKQYCSDKCKREAAAAKGGGSGGSSNGGGSSENVIAAVDVAGESVKKDGMQTVMAVSFEGDVTAVVNSLSNLLTIFNANKPGGVFSEATEVTQAKKGIRAAALEKMELGIMTLRSKGDTINADFFQKKLDELKPKGLFGRKK
jgi:hypothetical protein